MVNPACPACGKEVVAKDPVCPFCGGSLERKRRLPIQPPSRRSARRTVLAVVGALAGVAVIAALAAGLLASLPATVYVDNGYPFTLVLTVDGEDRGEVPPNGWKKIGLKPGTRRLAVRPVNPGPVEEHPAKVEPGRKYLFNPGAAVAYEVTFEDYLDDLAVRTARPEDRAAQPPVGLPKQVWRDITGYDFAFVPFPSQVKAPKGVRQTRRSRIARAE